MRHAIAIPMEDERYYKAMQTLFLGDGRSTEGHYKVILEALRAGCEKDEFGNVGPWFQTRSGRPFYFLDAKEGDIDTEDIFSGLSQEARFGGQALRHYSVGMHSLLGSEELKDNALAFEFLLHDATEAYLKDIPTPLKMLLPVYKAIEWNLEQTIRRRFGLPLVMSPEVKLMDARMFASEYKVLCLQGKAGSFSPREEPLPGFSIPLLSPREVEDELIRRFYELGGK